MIFTTKSNSEKFRTFAHENLKRLNNQSYSIRSAKTNKIYECSTSNY